MSFHDPNQPFRPPPFTPQQPPKPHTVRNVLLICLAGFITVVGGCSAIVVATTDPADSPAVSATRATSTTTTPEAPVVARTTPPPAPSSTLPTSKAPPTVSAKPKPVVYKKITSRQWKLIAKSPDAHIGEAIIIYGRVAQFDAATGTDSFRADVDGMRHRPSYGYVDYPTNTVLAGDVLELADLVEDDLFTAKVTVSGSLSYDTQIGGETTVPSLRVTSITVTGSVAD